MIDLIADADLLCRWPHLRQPGPQPINQLAGTAAEQLARAKVGRLSRAKRRAQRLAALVVAHPDVIAPALAEVLADRIAAAIAAALRAERGAA